MRSDEIQDLREQRKRTHNEMLKLNEVAEAEKRDLTAEESQEYDRMLSEFEDLEKRVRRQAQLSEHVEAAGSRRSRWCFSPRARRRPTTWPSTGPSPARSSSRTFPSTGRRSTTSSPPSTRSPIWRSKSSACLSKATAGAGGNIVPTDMYDQIIRSLRFQGSIASLAKEIRTSTGDNLNIPSNTTHGTSTWTAENVGFTASDEVFGTAQLNAYKAATQIVVSEELLQDSAFPLDSFLATEFGERTAVLEETAFIIGDGSGKPSGVLATNATTNATLVTAAVGNTTTFNYAALVTAVFSLPYQYRARASVHRQRHDGAQPVPDARLTEPAALERQPGHHWRRTPSSATRSTRTRMSRHRRSR